MLDYLWVVMLIIGVLWGILNGRADEVTQGVLSGAKEAVTLAITMLGIMSAWTGIMKVAERSGLIRDISEKMSPFMRFMFPGIKKNTPAYNYMCTNIAANVLGLGWAATPAGLRAMEELAKENNGQETDEYGRGGAKVQYLHRKRPPDNINGAHKKQAEQRKQNLHSGRAASDEMCTFLILNISSLQLIPVNIIAYRSQYGSTEPAGIIVPALAATFASTLAGIIFCKCMLRRKHRLKSF